MLNRDLVANLAEKTMFCDYRIYNQLMDTVSKEHDCNPKYYTPLFRTPDGFNPDFVEAMKTMTHDFRIEHPGIVQFTLFGVDFCATPGWDEIPDHIVNVQVSDEYSTHVAEINLLPRIVTHPNGDEMNPYKLYHEMVCLAAVRYLKKQIPPNMLDVIKDIIRHKGRLNNSLSILEGMTPDEYVDGLDDFFDQVMVGVDNYETLSYGAQVAIYHELCANFEEFKDV